MNSIYSQRPRRDACGLCTRSIDSHDRFVAIETDNHGSSFRSLKIADSPRDGQAPEWAKVRSSHGEQLYGHYRQSTEGEYSPLHLDCFKAVTSGSKQDRRLLDGVATRSTWRSPWETAPDMALCDTQSSFVVLPPTVVLKKLGLLLLENLPPELCEMVYQFSWNSPLWRFSQVMADGLSTISHGSDDRMKTMSLGEVQSWHRGETPIARPKEARLADQLYRATIDSRGIRNLEILASDDSSQSSHSERTVSFLRYTFLNSALSQACNLHFKHGLTRIKFDSGVPQPPTWDTSTPPSLQNMMPRLSNISGMSFRTIRLAETRGLTFFYVNGKAHTIHVHTLKEPNAMATFDTIPSSLKDYVTWVYLPLSPKDPMTNFGVRKLGDSPIGYTFCSDHAGDVEIGQTFANHDTQIESANQAPTSFVYGTTNQSLSLQLFACIKNHEGETDTYSSTRRICHPFSNAHYSQAPLKNTLSIQYFIDANGFCKGLLLTYENQSQRALGQCRFGKDTIVIVEKPKRLCLRQVLLDRTGDRMATEVEVGPRSGALHQHGRHDHWRCSGMSGSLVFWYVGDESSFEFLAT